MGRMGRACVRTGVGGLLIHWVIGHPLDPRDKNPLPLPALPCLDAAVEPSDGAVHGLGEARGVVRHGGDHVVELHHDVRADAVLTNEEGGREGCGGGTGGSVSGWMDAERGVSGHFISILPTTDACLSTYLPTHPPPRLFASPPRFLRINQSASPSLPLPLSTYPTPSPPLPACLLARSTHLVLDGHFRRQEHRRAVRGALEGHALLRDLGGREGGRDMKGKGGGAE